MLKTEEIRKKFVKTDEGAQVNQLNPTDVIVVSFATGAGKLTMYPYDKIKKLWTQFSSLSFYEFLSTR